MCCDSGGWAIRSRTAARPKCSSSATATKYRRWRNSGSIRRGYESLRTRYWTFEWRRPENRLMKPSTLTVASMTTADEAAAFRTLNEEWISRFFTIEESDRKTLGDPFAAIVEPGGDVLVLRDGGQIVGCVALMHSSAGVFELSKMAVTPAARGRGLGRQLIEAAIARARQLGATTLFLVSSTKLPNAVHLYETAGFQHVGADEIPLSPYARADVFMRMTLPPA
ncbi:GNAT family N-acetyltransferase [Micromonospora sp. bgisy143]|uniref:GNAT family N-acetyltransferase n=1 Tax=Micromonospora sp. bgisy143 TaxID=3413790 RepID=UPI003EBD3525